MTISGYSNAELRFGSEVEIIKLRPDGTEAAKYYGTLLSSPPGWVVARAVWTFKRVDLGHLVFEPEDYLVEYFATDEPFNAFAIFSPDDRFKGWYCNITQPTEIRNRTIIWHDLYIDIIQGVSGDIKILDEDELADSGIGDKDPALHQMITAARDSVVAKLRKRQYPFSEVDLPSR